VTNDSAYEVFEHNLLVHGPLSPGPGRGPPPCPPCGGPRPSLLPPDPDRGPPAFTATRTAND